MRGSIRQRGEKSWRLTLEFGYVRNPETGKAKRVQKYITFHGTKRDAETKLNELVKDAQDGTFVQPHKKTVGQWLDEWVELAIKPPRKTQRAYDTYKSVIALHLKSKLGDIRLQALRTIDIESFLASKSELALATLEKIFTVLNSALKAAARNRPRLVAENVAALVTNKPRASEDHQHVIENCWTADEAAAFLAAAKVAGPQPAALWGLALDSGMRRSELAGLLWADVNLAEGKVLVRQQLLTGGAKPVFIGTKGKRARSIDIAPETVELLRAHKAHQASLKMRRRQQYHDFGLVFAKEWADGGRRHDVLGQPLDVNNIAERGFDEIIAAAGVPRITIHGLRHTCASLLLAAGVPSKVVQERLGHKDISTTLDVYAHVLPGQQRDAARQLAALLHGK